MTQGSQVLPKLVVFGKEDKINSLGYIDYIRSKWKHGLMQVELINCVGHMPFWEDKDTFNTIAVNWAAQTYNRE
jgi:pimeloyl-ACP methyl ester carboxylesterase